MAKLGDLALCQVMERVWLIMALIGCALSDHPIIRSEKLYRHRADQARKALFDLHGDLQAVLDQLDEPSLEGEDDFGKKLLRRKGSVPASVVLEGDRPKDAKLRRSRHR